MGFYFICQLVTVSSLRLADDFNQLSHLALLAGRKLTDLPERLHNLRLRRRGRWQFLRRQHQTARHHPHPEWCPGLKTCLSQDKMRSEYDSVVEQSGIYAGKGGFDITVGNPRSLMAR